VLRKNVENKLMGLDEELLLRERAETALVNYVLKNIGREEHS
jgi:hypothetical protein